MPLRVNSLNFIFGMLSAFIYIPNKQRRAIHLITQLQSSVNPSCIKKITVHEQ
jgi:hypothetical protein